VTEWHFCAIGLVLRRLIGFGLRTSLGNRRRQITYNQFIPVSGLWVLAKERQPVAKLLQQLWADERGQDIAEYAVMLAVILVIVVGTIRLIGSNANNVFSQVGSSIAQ
jgi:Flp pilus assembly pilin Flp